MPVVTDVNLPQSALTAIEQAAADPNYVTRAEFRREMAAMRIQLATLQELVVKLLSK